MQGLQGPRASQIWWLLTCFIKGIRSTPVFTCQFIMSDTGRRETGQMVYRTGRTQEWREEGQEGCRTGGILDRRVSVEEWGMQEGGIQKSGLDGLRKEGMQDRWDAGQEKAGRWRRRMQDRWGGGGEGRIGSPPPLGPLMTADLVHFYSISNSPFLPLTWSV